MVTSVSQDPADLGSVPGLAGAGAGAGRVARAVEVCGEFAQRGASILAAAHAEGDVSVVVGDEPETTPRRRGNEPETRQRTRLLAGASSQPPSAFQSPRGASIRRPLRYRAE